MAQISQSDISAIKGYSETSKDLDSKLEPIMESLAESITERNRLTGKYQLRVSKASNREIVTKINSLINQGKINFKNDF